MCISVWFMLTAKGLEANLRHMLSNQSAVGVTFAQRSCPSLLPTSGTETGCDEVHVLCISVCNINHVCISSKV